MYLVYTWPHEEESGSDWCWRGGWKTLPEEPGSLPGSHCRLLYVPLRNHCQAVTSDSASCTAAAHRAVLCRATQATCSGWAGQQWHHAGVCLLPLGVQLTRLSVSATIGLQAEPAFLSPQLPHFLFLASLGWEVVSLGLSKCLCTAALEDLVISCRYGQQF